jgi:hypothetical protein
LDWVDEPTRRAPTGFFPRWAAINNRLILVSDVVAQRSAHNLIKLRIGN